MLVYFVFGFILDALQEDLRVVIGYYDTNSRLFIIDYAGERTKEVYEKYTSGGYRLPVVTLNGVTRMDYAEMLTKEYVRKSLFSVNSLSYTMGDEEQLGYYRVEDGESLNLDLRLLDDYVWSGNLKKVNNCDIWFRVEDFLGMLYLDIEVLSKMGTNVEEWYK